MSEKNASSEDESPAGYSPTWTYQGYRLDAGNFTTAMVHLYRAEVTRANIWRSRLDSTTNWAVITTAAALTFSFGSIQNPHFVLLLVLFLVLAFLNTEARRYSYYALWYHRVRLLETDFFARIFAPPYKPSPEWAHKLSESLTSPAFPISRLEALATRYRRNYVGLVTLLIFSWVLKLTVHPTTAQSSQDILDRASIGNAIPGFWVVLAVGLIYVALSGLTVVVSLRQKRRLVKQEPLRERHVFPFQRQRPEAQLAIIITDHKEALASQLMQELSRGVTALTGTGMYTGEPRDVLMCAVTGAQIKHLETIVREVDPTAFLIVAEASAVRGRGFQPFEPPS